MVEFPEQDKRVIVTPAPTRQDHLRAVNMGGLVHHGEQNMTAANAPDPRVHQVGHYGGEDCFDAMLKAFGPAEVAIFSKINAFKYLWRAGDKPETPTSVDLKKANWYLNKAADLEQLLEKSDQNR